MRHCSFLHVYLSYFTNPASFLPHWNREFRKSNTPPATTDVVDLIAGSATTCDCFGPDTRRQRLWRSTCILGKYTTLFVDATKLVYGANTSTVWTIEEWFKVERRLVNSYTPSIKTFYKEGLRRMHFEDEMFCNKVLSSIDVKVSWDILLRTVVVLMVLESNLYSKWCLIGMHKTISSSFVQLKNKIIWNALVWRLVLFRVL